MITAYACKTAYLTDPIGLDLTRPQLNWKVSGAQCQTAYQLRFAINEGDWKERDAEQSSDMFMQFPAELKSRERVCWQIRLTDENGETGPWSETARFEIGLIHSYDWKAKWIMGAYPHSKDSKKRYPVDCFRRRFSISGPVERARLYITACGLYETKLNGVRVGDQVLAPGSTAFQKRVHFQTYDVTDLIGRENEWTIDLADGWYAGNTGVFNKAKAYGNEPKVLAQLELFYEDGSRESVGTDAMFRWSNDGPVRLADMKDGEVVDFRWEPSYRGYAQETDYNGLICASNSNPVREKERFANPSVLHTPNGQTVLDFGQNLAGYMEVTVSGESGHTCSMVFGEKLNEEGNFTVANIAWKGEYDTCHFQTNELICDGEKHFYKPRFTVMGFRYVLLQDWPEKVEPENFTAIAVYSDMDTTFRFTSSDENLSRIVRNTLWSVKGNFLDVPTDCPTRERAGWTGDAQLFYNTGNYMMDQRAFFRKWLRDVADCQKENGLVHNINPSPPGASAFIEWISMEGSAGWGDAMITIPWYFWKRYGDDGLVREFWPEMEKCWGFFRSRLGRRNLFSLFTPRRSEYDRYVIACGRHFGEWTEPEDCAPGSTALLLPMTEEATAYFSYSSRLMSEMAAHMGKVNEAADYADFAEKSMKAYNHYFVQNGEVESRRMCKYVRPCGLGLAEGEARQRLLKKIVELNRERVYRIGTGFLTTPFVFEMLSEGGDSDGAYRTLTNPEIGWVQQIRQGATTVWENWTPDASLNHYSKGACCQWLFDCICGVKLDDRRNHFVIEPHILSRVDSIFFSYDSAYGAVESGWTKKDGKIIYAVTVPANCEAELKLPGCETKTLSAGSYTFETEG